MKASIFLFVTFIALISQARETESTLAVSQGISHPSNSTLINFKHGFAYQNSAGASQLNGPQISLEFDDNEDTDDNGMGAELGLGNGNFGLALGYYKRSCDNCEGRMGAVAGVGLDSWAVGFAYREKGSNSLGLLLGAKSDHRVGVAVDINDENKNNKIQSYGLGYSFVNSDFVFSLDASKRKDESTLTDDDIVQLTPGLMVKTSFVALSLSYDTYLSDDNEVYENEIWAGLGFQKDSWDLNIYKDFVSDWAVNFVYRF